MAVPLGQSSCRCNVGRCAERESLNWSLPCSAWECSAGRLASLLLPESPRMRAFPRRAWERSCSRARCRGIPVVPALRVGMQSRTLSVPAATSVTQTVRVPALEHGYDLREDHAPKVIPHPVDKQSSAEHLIGVKTMSGAFRVFWVS